MQNHSSGRFIMYQPYINRDATKQHKARKTKQKANYGVIFIICSAKKERRRSVLHLSVSKASQIRRIPIESLKLTLRNSQLSEELNFGTRINLIGVRFRVLTASGLDNHVK